MPRLKRDLLSDVNRKAEQYASKASQLSDLLEEAETFLQEMPGKIQTEAQGECGALAFRKGPAAWRLYWREGCDYFDESSGEDWVLVTDASVVVKSLAAQVLPMLVERIFTTQEERLEEVEKALQCLATVPFLSVKPGKEGS